MLGATIPCYRLTYYLPLILKSLKVDRICITNMWFPWTGKSDSEDKTEKIIRYDKRITLLKDNWIQQSDQRNAGIKELKRCEYIFLLDSDEILLPKDQERLVEFARKNPRGDTYGCLCRNYIGDFSHITTMNLDHRPVVLVKPTSEVREVRNTCGRHISTDKITLHHLKFLQPIEDIYWRVEHKADKRSVGGVKKISKARDIEQYIGNRLPKKLLKIKDISEA